MDSQLSPVGRFQTLLLATDGTECSAGAESVALGAAARCESRLILMRVVLTNPEYESMAPDRVADETAAARDDLERLRQQAVEMGVACETVIRHGVDAYLPVVQVADEKHVDCIVVGRQQRSDLARLMVGDSTARIIGHSPCSVLVAAQGADRPRRRILVATDGSRLGDAACVAAAHLSEVCELPLTVLTVTSPDQNEERRVEASQTVQRVLDSLMRERRGRGAGLEGMVEQGRPDAVIVDVARSRGADLIVVGSHGRTGLKRLFMGSVSERVIGHAPCPVLVIK